MVNATISSGHITATRPKHFFRDDVGMPEVINLRVLSPHGFADLGQTEWATNLVTERVRAKEATHRQRRVANGITVLGRDGILRQKPFDCPPGHAPRFQALLHNRGFIEMYRAAFRAHVAGMANVLFPFGTYWLRKINVWHHAVLRAQRRCNQ